MRRTFLTSVVAGMLLACAAVPAWAYFTDHHEATGGFTIRLEPTTTVTETYESGMKVVTIRNLDTSDVEVFVRARVFASNKLTPRVTWQGDTWREGDDGWYYCVDALGVGEDAKPLKVELPEMKSGNPEAEIAGLAKGDNFNVIVVYEATPVYYEDGQAVANWDLAGDVA